MVVRQTQSPAIKFLTIPTQTLQIIKKTEDLDLSTHPVTPVVKLTIPQRNVTLEQTRRSNQPPPPASPGTDNRKDEIKSNREMLKATQMGTFKLNLILYTRNATFSLRSCM